MTNSSRAAIGSGLKRTVPSSARETKSPIFESKRQAVHDTPEEKILAKKHEFFSFAALPLKERGTEKDLQAVTDLLNRIDQVEKSDHKDLLNLLAIFFDRNPSAKAAIATRPERRKVLIAIAETYRRFSVLTQIELVEAKNRDAAEKRDSVTKDLQLLEKQKNEIVELIERYKVELSELVQKEQKATEVVWALFDNDLKLTTDFLETKWLGLEKNIEHSVEEMTLKRELSWQRKIIEDAKKKLENVVQESKDEKLLEQFNKKYRSQWDIFFSLDFKLDQQVDQIKKMLHSLIPLEKMPELLTQACGFIEKYLLPDVFPFNEIQAAISAQKSWVRSEPHWNNLEEYAKKIYIKWARLLNGHRILGGRGVWERIAYVEKGEKEQENLKKRCAQITSDLEGFKIEVLQAYNDFCKKINAIARAAFQKYKMKNQWQALIKQCDERLKILDAMDVKNIIARNQVRQPAKPRASSVDEMPSTQREEVVQAVKQFELNVLAETKKLDGVKNELKLGLNQESKEPNFVLALEQYKKFQIAVSSARRIQEEKYSYVLPGPIKVMGLGLDLAVVNVLGEDKESPVLKRALWTKKAELEDALRAADVFLKQNKEKIQEMLFDNLLAIIAGLFSDQNLKFLQDQVYIRSRSSVKNIQVPQGFAMIYEASTQTRGPSQRRLEEVIKIATQKDNEGQGGCFSFFRKNSTRSAYAAIAKLKLLINDIQNYTDLGQLGVRVDRFKEELAQIGDVKNNHFILATAPSAIASFSPS